MRAILRLPAGLPPDAAKAGALEALQQDSVTLTKSIVATIQEEVEAYAADPEHERLVELCGQAPVHGADSRFEWSPDLDPARKAGGDASAGRMDFYNQSAFTTVSAGQAIGRIVPPTPGEDGCDLWGKTWAARPGRALALVIDQNITRDAEDRLVARASGQVSFSGTRLKINQCLRVDGDVDFNTGNINFQGDVDVIGGVRDVFSISAGGSLRVHGLVEAATIQCGGDFHADGGMAGKGKGSVAVDGNLVARYLDNVPGAIKKDACIRREMVNCRCTVGGRLLLPTGALIGGVTHVTGAVQVAQLGSPACTPTVLYLASAPALEAVLVGAEKALTEISQQISDTDVHLSGLTTAKRGMTASSRERLTELMCDKGLLTEKLERIQAKRRTLLTHFETVRKADLTVATVVNPGVTLVADAVAATFDQPLRGPVWIGWDDHKELMVKVGSTGYLVPLAQYVRFHAVREVPAPADAAPRAA